MKDWVKEFRRGRISRREFVERAAAGGLGVVPTLAVLGSAAKAQTAPRAHDYNQTNFNPYFDWQKQQEIPIYRDYAVTDIRALEVKPWKQLGVNGALIDLVGGEGVNDGHVMEIPPGASTRPQRYLFEEILYVLSGEGETAIWNPGRARQTVRWKAGAVLGPPLNAWRQHFNRGAVPVRILAMTNAPVVIDLFHNLDFVFHNDYVFRDRYDGQPDFFGASESMRHHKEPSPESTEMAKGVDTWESGFVADARHIPLSVARERGESNTRVELQLADNTMQAHISEFEVGTYKKAHRHGPGSHVVMLNGAGYTLMWKGSIKYSEAPKPVRVDWKEGSLFVPPDGWFHQHFNAGGDPARYLAATWGGDGKWFMRSLGGGGRTHRLGKTTTRKGGNLIEYEDEDPVVREIFEAELKKSGIPMRMKSGKGAKS